MAAPLHLELTTRVTPTSQVRNITLRRDGGAEAMHVRYEIPGGGGPDPRTLDGFVHAILLYAMQLGAPLIVHGPLSRTALYNIEGIQSFWNLWRPALYKRIDVQPEAIVDLERRKPGRRAIAAFSGGVDSTFTALRHKLKLAGTGSYNLDTVLMVHGFDVASANSESFDQLVRRTEPLLSHLDLDLKIVRTNSKELRLTKWENSFGPLLAGCLHLFSAQFEFGLVASSEPYNDLFLPWGSNPITDGLLSGDAFAIIHDGAGFSRTDKIATIARYPAAVAGLKVCWEGSEQHKNCGVCEKCVRTRLNFLAVGEPSPACFEGSLDLSAIASIPIRNHPAFAQLRSIASFAQERQVKAEWLERLNDRLNAHERQVRAERRREHLASALEAIGMKTAVKRGLQLLRLMR